LSQIKKIAFRLGSTYLTLEVPPFYVNFEKRNFGSIMGRRHLPKEGTVVYVYVTRHRHVENLLVLKRLHPDLNLPDDLKEPAIAIEELTPVEFDGFLKAVKIEGFVKAIERLEDEWKYCGDGIWLREIDPFTLYMILITKGSRWTVRPAISKDNVRGFGFEVPVDTGLSDAFMREINEGELEEIHEHVENRHFHLNLDSLHRCVSLARDWDYYFSTMTKWRQTVFLSENYNAIYRKDIKSERHRNEGEFGRQ